MSLDLLKVSCGNSVVCFLETLCLDRPTTLLCGSFALVIGIYGFFHIRTNSISISRNLYSTLWFTFAIMMTVSGILHSIVRDSPTKDEPSVYPILRFYLSLINVGLTSSIGYGFGVVGLMDICGEPRLFFLYLLGEIILFGLWIYAFVTQRAWSFYLYVLPVSCGCALYLVCQCILYVKYNPQYKMVYPNGTNDFKHKWLAHRKEIREGNVLRYYFTPVSSGQHHTGPLIADQNMNQDMNQNMNQQTGNTSFNSGNPNSSIYPYLHHGNQSDCPVYQPYQSYQSYQPYQNLHHQQYIYPNLQESQQAPISNDVPYIQFGGLKGYRYPGLEYFLLGGLSGIIGIAFFIPLARYWCSIVGEVLGAWFGPEFIWFIFSDLAMLSLLIYIIKSDTIRPHIAPVAVNIPEYFSLSQ